MKREMDKNYMFDGESVVECTRKSCRNSPRFIVTNEYHGNHYKFYCKKHWAELIEKRKQMIVKEMLDEMQSKPKPEPVKTYKYKPIMNQMASNIIASQMTQILQGSPRAGKSSMLIDISNQIKQDLWHSWRPKKKTLWERLFR